ncbi:MAG TPA: bifunctional hydroxymethylpyrimidine kinase/phosphomethylpyrimidine kinase [Methanosarcinaceae archaeon]|nr:bifunctional hydroxymethylpyrimidine kinase/phosphomethylpyrimidine kinase [Methanosarcinaceae archaeon]
MTKTPAVLTIAGTDSSGGAGVSADLKTFASIGAHGTCAITSVTSQNTTGVISAFDMPPPIIMDQIDAVCTDMNVQYAKTGMLASAEIVSAVSRYVKKYNLVLVVDPVMAAEAGGELLTTDAMSVIRDELLPLCMVVTPNTNEASALSGIVIQDRNDAKHAAKIIADMGAVNVIITGGHLDASDVVYESKTDTFTVISGEFIEGGTHGSGCTYSAALTAYLAHGHSIVNSARYAKHFVEHAIRESVPIGSGVAPVNQVAHIRNNATRYEVLNETGRAVEILTECLSFANLVPEVSCNIAMAIPDASNVWDVAAVSGRIVKHKGKAVNVGCVEFGASSHVARIILAAMQFDNNVRASVNIKYSMEVLEICKKLNLTISSFDRADEPEKTSTMDWGVTHAIKEHGSVPDIISDAGGIGKEPMVRILGSCAQDVAKTAVKIAKELDKL